MKKASHANKYPGTISTGKQRCNTFSRDQPKYTAGLPSNTAKASKSTDTYERLDSITSLVKAGFVQARLTSLQIIHRALTGPSRPTSLHILRLATCARLRCC